MLQVEEGMTKFPTITTNALVVGPPVTVTLMRFVLVEIRHVLIPTKEVCY